MEIAVIITTYNSPLWLEKVLWGYASQSERDFQIVIADDGSGEETRHLIERLRSELNLPLHHIWHEDEGFRKTIILNKAIVAVEADYLLFTDGDCIPRRDFVAQHRQHARPGYFLSGGYFKIPLSVSETVTREDVELGRFADLQWLRAQGVKPSAKDWKLRGQGPLARSLDALTTTKASWNGMNSSGWKSDLLAVNGFDERMQYGGLDRELGERLMNARVKSKQIRHSAICIHLDHARAYANQASWEKNKAIRQNIVKNKIAWTPFGIQPSEQSAESITSP